MTLDEYDAMIRGKYAEMSDEEYYGGDELYYEDEPYDIPTGGRKISTTRTTTRTETQENGSPGF
jgi:hypothetical protein